MMEQPQANVSPEQQQQETKNWKKNEAGNEVCASCEKTRYAKPGDNCTNEKHKEGWRRGTRSPTNSVKASVLRCPNAECDGEEMSTLDSEKGWYFHKQCKGFWVIKEGKLDLTPA
jgi:hypothetical protein